MNSISNIWNHPKTSAAGLLIAVVTIASALTQQGITLGAAGNGTVVTLISGLATALLGLLARDPASSGVNTNSANSTVKLGVWALISLLLPLPFMSGCSARTVAQEMDAGARKRRSNSGFDCRAAGLGRCTGLCRGNGRV
jgi:hypothetical protein